MFLENLPDFLQTLLPVLNFHVLAGPPLFQRSAEGSQRQPHSPVQVEPPHRRGGARLPGGQRLAAAEADGQQEEPAARLSGDLQVYNEKTRGEHSRVCCSFSGGPGGGAALMLACW